MVRPTTLAPDLYENIRRRWEETDESIETIAIDVGVYGRSMRRLAKRWGWKARKGDAPREMSDVMKLGLVADSALDVPPEQAGVSDRSAMPTLIERLESAVEKELAVVETLRAQLGNLPSAPVDNQRTAQTLASLTETLSKVQRLRMAGAPATGAIDDVPADADDFRRSLAERIEQFIRSRVDPGLAGAGELPGDQATGA